MKSATIITITGVILVFGITGMTMAETVGQAVPDVQGPVVDTYTQVLDPSDFGATVLSTGAIERLIIQKTNNERTSIGLNPLVKKRTLTRKARRWCGHMINQNLLHHPNSLPRGVYGQNCAVMPAGISIGFPCSGGSHYVSNTADGVAWAVMDEFMNHDFCDPMFNGHRNNILRNWYTKIGVGVKYGRGMYWVTQNFA